MFLSLENKELLVELIRDLPGELSVEEIDGLMKQFYTDDSLPLLETNKKFLLYYLQIINDKEPKKETPKLESEHHIPLETLMMEMTFVKQELNELKKTIVLLTQLIQQNTTIAQNANGN